MNCQHSKQDTEKYPILQNNSKYTDWIINIMRQFENDRCTRVIDDSFKKTMVKWGPINDKLYKAELKYIYCIMRTCTSDN